MKATYFALALLAGALLAGCGSGDAAGGARPPGETQGPGHKPPGMAGGPPKTGSGMGAAAQGAQ